MRLLSRVGVADRWGSGELGIDWVCVGLALLQPPIVVLAGSGRAAWGDRERKCILIRHKIRKAVGQDHVTFADVAHAGHFGDW